MKLYYIEKWVRVIKDDGIRLVAFVELLKSSIF